MYVNRRLAITSNNQNFVIFMCFACTVYILLFGWYRSKENSSNPTIPKLQQVSLRKREEFCIVLPKGKHNTIINNKNQQKRKNSNMLKIEVKHYWSKSTRYSCTKGKKSILTPYLTTFFLWSPPLMGLDTFSILENIKDDVSPACACRKWWDTMEILIASSLLMSDKCLLRQVFKVDVVHPTY